MQGKYPEGKYYFSHASVGVGPPDHTPFGNGEPLPSYEAMLKQYRDSFPAFVRLNLATDLQNNSKEEVFGGVKSLITYLLDKGFSEADLQYVLEKDFSKTDSFPAYEELINQMRKIE